VDSQYLTWAQTIVSNESSEIIRMFYTEFDALLPLDRREASNAGGGLLPSRLRKEIEGMNDWVYNTVNNGSVFPYRDFIQVKLQF